MLVHLANGTTVDIASAVAIVPAIYNSTSTLVPSMPVATLYILEAILSSCVFVLPFPLPPSLLLTGLCALLLLVIWL